MAPIILELLSFRTFSSVWYWIAVGATWAAVAHRPMGVPYDMVWRAHREGQEARDDLDAVAGALARRLVGTVAGGATVIVAVVSAALSALLLLGFVYGLELAQGLVLVALPLALVGWFSLRTARAIDSGGEPARHLRRLRIATNGIGLVALFVSAFWGVYVSVTVSVL